MNLKKLISCKFAFKEIKGNSGGLWRVFAHFAHFARGSPMVPTRDIDTEKVGRDKRFYNGMILLLDDCLKICFLGEQRKIWWFQGCFCPFWGYGVPMGRLHTTARLALSSCRTITISA